MDGYNFMSMGFGQWLDLIEQESFNTNLVEVLNQNGICEN